MVKSDVTRRTFLRAVGVSSGALLLSGCADELASDESELASISTIEVETWTQDVDNAQTGGRVDCTVTFDDGRAFTKQLAGDMSRGQRQRRSLDLSDVQAILLGQSAATVRSLTFRLASSDMWKCNGVCLRVNGVVVLSRTALKQIENGQSFVIHLRKDGRLDGLEVLISTADEDFAGTDDRIYGNVAFSDGTSLFASDFYLHSTRNDWERGDTYAYPIYLPSSAADPNAGLTPKRPADIASFSLSEPGNNGWLLAAAYLFANGSGAPLVGNGAIHQRLGAEDRILQVTRWSSATVLGPVLGHVSASSAAIVYRVEREGTYKVRLFADASGAALIGEDTRQLAPTATFRFGGLVANTSYWFRFYRVASTGEAELAGAGGALRTFPSEATGSGVRFSFAAGSCLSPGDDVHQLAWDGISAAALDPAAPTATNDLRFFVHMGDTFYFYDEILGAEPAGKAGMVAAHLSNRTHPRFLAMARKVPCCAIWDDHDFRKNNSDSVGMSQQRKDLYRDTFLEYWGNPTPANAASFGLTTRLTCGEVDVYLMDGRYNRRKTTAPTQCFSAATIDWVLGDIDQRGPGRLRILVSGSPWDYLPTVSPLEYDTDKYGHANYATERTNFYAALAARIANGTIKGLVFMTGERHLNKIFEVPLASSGLVAPELMISPLGDRDPEPSQNTSLGAKWNAEASRHGFGRVSIDTTSAPWTLRVQFYDTNVSPAAYYYSRTYTLVTNAAGGGEFRWAQSS